jgi:hypothetical protein
MNVQRIKEIIEELRAELGSAPYEAPISMTLDVRNYTKNQLSLHGFKTYSEAEAALRAIGVGKRSKGILGEHSTVLSGFIGDIEFTAFCDDLPPSCKVVSYAEKIPKQQTVDTGEFIEVSRTKIVCGQEKEEA